MAAEGKETADSRPPHVRVILGTMTFSGQTDKAASLKQLRTFAEGNTVERRAKVELDTARMYGKGATEALLGEIFSEEPELRARYIVATKVNPFPGYNDDLTPDNVRAQSAACLDALRCDSTDILYLHAPDVNTPIEATLEAVQELYEAGKFRELGLSNYSAWETAHIWHLCKERGWVKPTVYQAMYNACTRAIEAELLPCCRTLGIRVYVYNPLAGGMLTGKHRSVGDAPSEGRFKDNKRYQDRYWTPAFFDAMDVVRDACDAVGISMADAALRWLVHHSQLRGGDGDGVIIGASTQSHLEANLASVTSPDPLPDAIVEAYDAAWEIAKAAVPPYARGYSGSGRR